MKPLSRTMLDNLAQLAERGGDQRFVHNPYQSSLDPLFARGLVDVERRWYLREPWLVPYARLTEAGIAALGEAQIVGLQAERARRSAEAAARERGWTQRPSGLLLSPRQLALVIERFAGANDPDAIAVLEQAMALRAAQAHRRSPD